MVKKDDPLWAEFVVNSCAIEGMFLWGFMML